VINMCEPQKSEMSPVETSEQFEANLAAVTSKFDEDVDRYIAGIPPEGGIYRLGNPGRILLSAGIKDLPIELSSIRLSRKASDGYRNNHPFNIAEVKGLPVAINRPIAVFNNVNGGDGKVILTELKHNGSNFVVAIRVRKGDDSRKIGVEANSIRSIFPKDQVQGIIGWLNSKNNLLVWVDKEKARTFISTQSPNQIAGGNKGGAVSTAIKKIESFQNPPLSKYTQKISESQ